MLPATITKIFAAHVRTRGDDYFAAGKVRVATATGVRLQALVKGTTPYVVEIHARKGSLDLSCTCPYAKDVGACKHAWAVLRQAEADGKLTALLQTSGWNPRAEFALDDDDGFDDDVDVESEPADDSSSDEYVLLPGRPSTVPPRGGQLRRPPPPPPIPDWMRVIDSAHRQMQYQPAATQVDAAWPANRRLVYLLDLQASANMLGLVIDIGTELRAANGSWGEPKRFTLGVPVWFAAPDPIDRQIAEMLCGASDAYAPVRTRTAGFVIAPRAVATTLRTILDTGRCRLRSSTPDLNGRTVRADGGVPWTFRVRVHADATGAQRLSGFLTRVEQGAAQEMPLSEPVMLHVSGLLITRDAVARFEDRKSTRLNSSHRH